MVGIRRFSIMFMVLLAPALPALGQQVSREQIKGLDEQVQAIKSDVLGIAAELNRLEEQLLFPSNTQVALFISLAPGENFRLDGLEIHLNGQPAAQHLYTFKELEALLKGGVQRIYTGNLRTGSHELRVSLTGRFQSGADFRKSETFRIDKAVGPKIVELCLAPQAITLKDW